MDYKLNTVNILGLNIAKIKRDELFTVLDNYLSGQEAKHIVTANPEILVSASSNDEELFSSANASDIILPDGIGLKFAALASFGNLYRFTGVELTEHLLKEAGSKELKVGIINWRHGLSSAEEIKKYVNEKYSNIALVVADVEKDERDIPQEIFEFEPEILLVTLGYGAQEKYLFYNKNKIPNLRIAVGVGGTFDLLTGKLKRAPRIMRFLGLEWTYRIIAQPRGKKLWRLKRLYDATFVFVYKFLKWRFVLPFLYRPNVACLMYKQTGQGYEVVIVKRSDIPDHWQLPQGGTDGLPIIDGGKKELSEELNTNSFIIKKTTEFISKYKFDNELLKKYKKGSKRYFGYKGQKQALLIALFTGSNDEISVNAYEHDDWRWEKISNLINVVHPIRHSQIKIFLIEFNKYIKNEKEN